MIHLRHTGSLIALVGALLLSACQSAPTPHIQTQAAPDADFSAYQTFSLTSSPEINVYGESQSVAQDMAKAIAQELTKKGYQQVASDGDLFINFRLELDNDVEAFNNAIPVTPDRVGYYRSWSSLYGPLPQEREGGTTRITYTGVINIDVVDREANHAVWQGGYYRSLTADDETGQTQAIQQAVQSLLFSLPSP
ncbi:DUF4136 domain-containing protein [uncultured Gilvimarinus sp.]|uniref:DUF4136 domain-containing protein n=1 Tax=uncultured Gilvimarinus sp. TaxID=1689143 RepID=UPI0030EBD28C|tara:strand:- start:494 stop:1075 length:582 start_codon:yes stop_codon:yes gene_type:complete